MQPSENKGEQTVQTAVEAASAQVNTATTPAQAEAGKAESGHVTIGDGFYAVYIRIVHRSRMGYIKTDKVISPKSITASGEFKDPVVSEY